MFSPFLLLFCKLSTIFFSGNEIWNAISFQIQDCCSLFYEKTLLSLNDCEARVRQTAIKSGKLGAKLTCLCGFSLDASFFTHVRKHRSWFWLQRIIFSRVKNIVRSSDWPELICVWGNLPIPENLVITWPTDRPSAPQAYQCLHSHFLATLGAQEEANCTSLLSSIDSCQNRVSADHYHLTVSRAQVSTIKVVYFWSYPLTIYSFSNDCRLTFTFF